MKSASRNRLSAAVRSALLFSLLPLAAVAQDEAQQMDRIEVTGSRIKRAEVEGQSPVHVVTREDIEQSGLTAVADIVQQLTGSGSSLNTRFNSSGNFGFPASGAGVGAGSATVDLRHLGSQRVLVLVDGIRWVNESSASGVSGSTDLNTIPVSIIERIEVLEDGASSIYGSDAIAGVVNIITRKSFDGASAAIYYGEFEEGGDTESGELNFGGSGDNYSFFMSASTTSQDGISSTKYEPASVPIPGTGLTFGSSATPQGRFDFIDPVTGQRRNITTPNGSFFPNGPVFPNDFIAFGTPTRFNFAQFNLMLTPNERKGVFGQGRFDFSDNVSGYMRVLYNQRESLNQAAPEPIFLGPGNGNFWMDNIVISASNPFSPFPFDLNADNINIVARRPIEGGPRRFFQDVDTWYFGAGLEGTFDFGDSGMFWNLNYARSSNEAEQTNFGSYNIRRIHTALGPLAGCQADPACTPLDIFSGAGSITPAMLAYIQPVIHDSSENEIQIVSGNLSGDLFELPAGPLGFAVGTEYRKYTGQYQPDALTVAGEYNGVPSLPTAGEYDVSEYYAEFLVPVYEAGESKLELTLAGRYSDYSTFGGETTGKLGLRWQINDQFLLRGTYAEGFRAPSIGELFGSAARFDAVIDDPCLIGVDGSAPNAPASLCAPFGIPAGAQQANSQISVTTGGNPNLQPEEADSYTAGFVFSPGFASDTGWSQRLDIEFSYYSHEIDGAIQAVDAQTQLDFCIAGGPASPFCDGIVRASNGFIGSFANTLQNFGFIETDGYDLDVFWTLPDNDWGSWKVSWQNTWVNDYEAVDAAGVVQPREVGVEVNDTGIPEWSSTLGLDWASGSFFASYHLRHVSDLTEECGDAVDFPTCSNPDDGTNRLGSTTYHDAQVGWNADWWNGTKFTLGVNNLFSKDPPICISCSLNGYDPSVYDLPAGRFIYARAEVKF